MVLSDKEKCLIINISDNSQFQYISENNEQHLPTLLTSRVELSITLHIESALHGVITTLTSPTEFSTLPTTDKGKCQQACPEGYISTDLV